MEKDAATPERSYHVAVDKTAGFYVVEELFVGQHALERVRARFGRHIAGGVDAGPEAAVRFVTEQFLLAGRVEVRTDHDGVYYRWTSPSGVQVVTRKRGARSHFVVTVYPRRDHAGSPEEERPRRRAQYAKHKLYRRREKYRWHVGDDDDELDAELDEDEEV